MTSIDAFDARILEALQEDGSLTNAALADRVKLSASQCSRRRAALEESGHIRRYRAEVDPERLGYGLRAIVRVNLRHHGDGAAEDFARWIRSQVLVRSAFSVSGDADYILDIRARDLESFSDFLHDRLLTRPQVVQVRSEFILRTIKDNAGLEIAGRV